MVNFFLTTWQTKFTSSGVKNLRFHWYRHICLRASGKRACNAINALQTQPRHTISAYQRYVYNEYLLFSVYCLPFGRYFSNIRQTVRLPNICRTFKNLRSQTVSRYMVLMSHDE